MTQQKIYTWQFMLLCFSSLLFFSSFNMIIPELPAFLTSIGGGDYKGLIISVFTLTAGLSGHSVASWPIRSDEYL
ncbi:MAG: hypothetical protein ACMVP2_02035 [Imperialibacter sp.]|uniref:hypothetical protein n=1 Tax=Imperialibacter sp. TaxID=2038411 RepID=UPI003A88322F